MVACKLFVPRAAAALLLLAAIGGHACPFASMMQGDEPALGAGRKLLQTTCNIQALDQVLCHPHWPPLGPPIGRLPRLAAWLLGDAAAAGRRPRLAPVKS